MCYAPAYHKGEAYSIDNAAVSSYNIGMDITKAKAFIFDMDGVVFDSEVNWLNADRAADKKFNTGFDPGVRAECCGRDEKSVRAFLRSIKPDLDVDSYREYIIDSVRRAEDRDGAPLKRGISELVALLKVLNIKTALATSSRRERVIKLFDKAGLNADDMFGAVLTCNDVTHAKPDPEIFLKAAERIGVAPNAAIVLEDSPNGLLAAVRGGFTPIMIVDLIEPPPDMVRDGLVHYPDVYPIIEQLRKGDSR